jgi:hypothetical protein
MIERFVAISFAKEERLRPLANEVHHIGIEDFILGKPRRNVAKQDQAHDGRHQEHGRCRPEPSFSGLEIAIQANSFLLSHHCFGILRRLAHISHTSRPRLRGDSTPMIGARHCGCAYRSAWHLMGLEYTG